MAEANINLVVMTDEPEETSEEVRWRMEQAQNFAASSGFTLTESAKSVNKALTILRQGNDLEPSDQKS